MNEYMRISSDGNVYFNINRNYDYSRMQEIKQTIPCLVEDKQFLPKRATATDAGADLMSIEDLEIYPGEQKLVSTGVATKIPEGYAGFVFNRSSQGKKGITIPHSVGVIDSGYRGEIKVLLKNISEDPYKISRGDRIAQLVLIPVLLPEFVDIWNDTERGTGGFGSTGT
jgi:dUTP pyrophosphatase